MNRYSFDRETVVTNESTSDEVGIAVLNAFLIILVFKSLTEAVERKFLTLQDPDTFDFFAAALPKRMGGYLKGAEGEQSLQRIYRAVVRAFGPRCVDEMQTRIINALARTDSD